MARLLYAEPVATTGDAPMDEVNQLLQVLVAKHPWPPNDAIMEEIFFKSTEFIQLKELCAPHWDSISDNLDSIVGGDAGKSILLVAFEDLEAESYITVLERMADKFHANQINKPVIRNMISMYGRKAHFLMDNSRHPRVRTLLKSLAPSLEGEAVYGEVIADMLSGQSKRTAGFLLIASMFVIGVVFVWRYFRKKGK